MPNVQTSETSENPNNVRPKSLLNPSLNQIRLQISSNNDNKEKDGVVKSNIKLNKELPKAFPILKLNACDKSRSLMDSEDQNIDFIPKAFKYVSVEPSGASVSTNDDVEIVLKKEDRKEDKKEDKKDTKKEEKKEVKKESKKEDKKEDKKDNKKEDKKDSKKDDKKEEKKDGKKEDKKDDKRDDKKDGKKDDKKEDKKDDKRMGSVPKNAGKKSSNDSSTKCVGKEKKSTCTTVNKCASGGGVSGSIKHRQANKSNQKVSKSKRIKSSTSNTKAVKNIKAKSKTTMKVKK